MSSSVWSGPGVIRSRSVVYVGLDALSDTTVSGAVGNSMFADLVSVAGDLYKHGEAGGLPKLDETPQKLRICLHADEFNELIGDEFIPMINKAGGAGFQVTAYTQTWSDVEARVGSRAKAGQVAGNFNTLIMLRVKELATAQMLTDQLPRVEVHALTQVSGVNDSSSPGSGVDFTWAFDTSGNAHARDIVTDTGWKIVLDRGLDIFQAPIRTEGFSLGDRLQEHRMVKGFYVTYVKNPG